MVLASLATAILVVVSLGACAGTDADAARNAYVRALNAAQERFARTASKVSSAITKESSVRQDHRTLVRYRATIDDLVRKLRSLRVPSDVRTEHDRLVTALVRFRREVSTATRDLRSPSTRGVEDARRRLVGATMTLNAQLGEAVIAINRELQSR
jgi:hypothetical protein